jgi:hypothetical protein
MDGTNGMGQKVHKRFINQVGEKSPTKIPNNYENIGKKGSALNRQCRHFGGIKAAYCIEIVLEPL